MRMFEYGSACASKQILQHDNGLMLYGRPNAYSHPIFRKTANPSWRDTRIV